MIDRSFMADGARIRVKICGLTREADARAAEAAGAFYGGVILAPGSPRTVDPARATAIFGGTDLARCGVFVNQDSGWVVEVADLLGLAVVQLHGDETPDGVAKIREATGATVWKAARPRSGAEFVEAADAFAGAADGLLLDGWSAAARGGTGVRFPWREVADARARMSDGMALIAAGGLNPENVAEVAALLAPDAVDVSSGVESAPGIKDSERIAEFIEAAKMSLGGATNR